MSSSIALEIFLICPNCCLTLASQLLVISDGLGLQRLEAGFRFPARDLRSGGGGESAES